MTNARLLEILRNDPKSLQKKLSFCYLLVIQNKSKLSELSSNGNLKRGTFKRQGLSEPQSAKEFSPARKDLITAPLKMPKIW